jgi:XTP/dITP diphosphohydrolase
MRLYFYTSNRFKFRIAERLLKHYGIALERVEPRYREVQAESSEDVVEDALRRVELLPAIAEDSGLIIRALHGFPGTITSYVQSTLSAEHLLRLMEGEVRREACFRSVVGLREVGGKIKLFRGEVCGRIAEEQRGSSKYWYDTIFIPEGETRTFAEMSFEEVLAMSDWKKSFTALGEYLRGRW